MRSALEDAPVASFTTRLLRATQHATGLMVKVARFSHREAYSHRNSSFAGHTHKYLQKQGWTEEQSSAVHIQAVVSADGIVLVISCKLQLLFINLASVPVGQLVNSPPAAILERYMTHPDKTINNETIKNI